MEFFAPIWLMQPIPYFGEILEGEWLWEPKIDGWRLQIIKHKDGRMEAWGRKLEKKPNWTEKLEHVLCVLRNKIPNGTLLDCELSTLVGRRFIPSLFSKKKNVKPLVYVFDVVFFEGEFLGTLPLLQRQKILNTIDFVPPFIKLESFPLRNIKNALFEALENKHEGIVMKCTSSKYIVCKDGPVATEGWRKLKG